MPEGMPFYLEKGPTLRLVEQYLNSHGPQVLADLKQPNQPNLNWLTNQALWGANERFVVNQTANRITEQWFGAGQQGGPAASTTGYWTTYRGQVDEIVRKTLSWALEIALGVDDTGKATRSPQWELELFWVCSADWFEGWVVTRPIDQPGQFAALVKRLGKRAARKKPAAAASQPGPLAAKQGDRAVVTVVFITPPHKGAVVAQSPLAVSGQANDANWTHPVSSWQRDYEKITPPIEPVDRKPQPPRNRRFATWVVTHRMHRLVDPNDPEETSAGSLVTTDTTKATLNKVVSPSGAVYSGYPLGSNVATPIVVVAPSMPSGGVRADGTVIP